MNQKTRHYRITLPLITLIFSFSILTTSSKSQEIKKPYTLSGNEATIIGKIQFEGEPPNPREIDMSADSECLRSEPNPITEDVVVTNGRVANVLVYVKSNVLDKYSFETPTAPVTVERRACQIIPHVFGIQTGQLLLVFNNSKTAHNTNVPTKVNPPWNISQPFASAPIERRFDFPERLGIIKDNQHPWERAYFGVFSHPFFYVTERDGYYTITGLPPGRYSLIAWHEKFGEKEVEIKVGAKETKNVDFTFTPEK
jgi:hypothetical protein